MITAIRKYSPTGLILDPTVHVYMHIHRIPTVDVLLQVGALPAHTPVA